MCAVNGGDESARDDESARTVCLTSLRSMCPSSAAAARLPISASRSTCRCTMRAISEYTSCGGYGCVWGVAGRGSGSELFETVASTEHLAYPSLDNDVVRRT